MELSHGDVVVRSGGEADVPALLAVVADDGVTRWWPADAHREMVESLCGHADDAIGFVIEVAGELAGYIQYYEEDDPQYRHAGIDIVIGEGFRDRGVGTTSVWLLARHLFEALDHHRLIIDPNAANHRAIRTYEKVGFKTVGVMRSYEYSAREGRWTDALLMDMLRDDLTGAP